MLSICRGDVVRVHLEGSLGAEIKSEPGHPRPAVVVQNDRGNAACATTIVAPLRNARRFRGYPETVFVPKAALPFDGSIDCVVQCGQLRTVDRDLRIDPEGVLCRLPDDLMKEVDAALAASLGLRP